MLPVSTRLHWVQSTLSSGLQLFYCSCFFSVGHEYAVNPSTGGRACGHTLHPQTFRPRAISGPEPCQGFKSTYKKEDTLSPGLEVHHTAMPGLYSKFSKSFMLVHTQQDTQTSIFLASKFFLLYLPAFGGIKLHYITM